MKLNLIQRKLSKTANPRKRPVFTSILLSAALAVFAFTNAQAQMNSWTMPPFRFDATANPVGINHPLYGSTSGSGDYCVANGAYDENGALLFYVQDNWVYDSGGNPVPGGQLGVIYGAGAYHDMGGEIAIVPVPGACSKYYVIYTGTENANNSLGYLSAGLGYIIVDCPHPSSTPVINYGSGCCPNMAYNPSGFINMISTFANSSNMSIAVSKKIGTGATAYYMLYFTTNWGIEACYINSSGITYGGAVSPIANAGSSTIELELSPDGNWIAAAQFPGGGGAGQVVIVDLPSAAIWPTQTLIGSYGSITGLEFVGSGTPKLYISGTHYSGGSAFDMVDLSAPSPVAVSKLSDIAPFTFDKSFLECSKSGKVCAITDYAGHRYLVEYDPVGSSVSSQQIDISSGVHVNPNGSNPIGGGFGIAAIYNSLYTLPDQIDGGDYDHFNVDVYITGMGINGGLAHPCDGTAMDVYSCAGVHITATTNDELKPCKQTLVISPVSGCDDITTTGVGYLHYTGEIASNIKDLAIHNIKDNYGNTLANVTGVYRVTLIITDCCGKSTQMTQLIHMRYAPNINLELYDYLFPTYVPAGPLHSSPLGVGAGSLGFRVNNSAGDADNMEVRVDELIGTWGGPMAINNVFDENVAVGNLASITNEQLNSYCVPTASWPYYITPACNLSTPNAGNSAFFSSNGPSIVGSYYKLTVTLSNECGSSSDYAYLQIVDGYARPTSVQTTTTEQNAVLVYPNPANDKVQIDITAKQPDVYQVSLYDVTGRLVKTIASNTSLGAGSQTLNVNTTDLPTGVYTWKINSQNTNQTGRINIVK